MTAQSAKQERAKHHIEKDRSCLFSKRRSKGAGEVLLPLNKTKQSGLCDDKMSHKFFTNTTCEFFPCHSGIDPAGFNCLFCYCPLYVLGKRCGGEFVYLENGIKDCSNCAMPHKKENYDAVLERFCEIAEVS